MVSVDSALSLNPGSPSSDMFVHFCLRCDVRVSVCTVSQNPGPPTFIDPSEHSLMYITVAVCALVSFPISQTHMRGSGNETICTSVTMQRTTQNVCLWFQGEMTLPCKSWRRYRGRLGRSGRGWGYTSTSVTTPLRRSNTEMRTYRCTRFVACGRGTREERMLVGEH